uniref:Uncharacterized protein n=1 Tax=Rhizophora mucronata TaxID=61149 RepID=A0A2P2NXM0_RHIMU
MELTTLMELKIYTVFFTIKILGPTSIQFPRIPCVSKQLNFL